MPAVPKPPIITVAPSAMSATAAAAEATILLIMAIPGWSVRWQWSGVGEGQADVVLGEAGGRGRELTT